MQLWLADVNLDIDGQLHVTRLLFPATAPLNEVVRHRVDRVALVHFLHAHHVDLGGHSHAMIFLRKRMGFLAVEMRVDVDLDVDGLAGLLAQARTENACFDVDVFVHEVFDNLLKVSAASGGGLAVAVAFGLVFAHVIPFRRVGCLSGSVIAVGVMVLL